MIRENVPLAPFTTLRIGGPARYFDEVRNENELQEALAFACDHAIPVFILGGGSNVLFADQGYPGLVIQIALRGVQWLSDGMISVCAGEDWDGFVRQCVERELAGIECLSGIPGFAGGTPVQNVGAYGQDVSETIVSVRAYDRLHERIVELSNEECHFAYRASIFNTGERDRYIVLTVNFALRPHGEPAIRYPDLEKIFAGVDERPALQDVREAVLSIRARKAMLLVPGDPDCRSAGSFFKNPVVTAEFFARMTEVAKSQNSIAGDQEIPHYAAAEGRVKVPAAWLIEHAGFHKGYIYGRAGISSKHSLAIVNRGGATAQEVIGLANEICERVQLKFGLRLQAEPVLVGCELA
ncbi:MAG: UDP-N-acetylmuramate dehydrogenase [Blastocatellia bacterium]|nr:UDP-N-acetylmuramate dehydrogenase [Blastocatellia bacterium]